VVCSVRLTDWLNHTHRESRGAESVSDKRKTKPPRNKPDLRIKGVEFKDALRALVQTPRQACGKKGKA
jgi:hypothetical protein